MMYLIVGRTGAGKDHFAHLLAEKGLKVVCSYATRPVRSEKDASSHIFITKEEAATYTDKVARTVINDYEYFATAEQVKNSDVYVIDPDGIDELVKNMPDTLFHIIYISAESDLDRRLHAVSRADDKIKEEIIFDNRCKAEDERFTAFEDKIRKSDLNVFPDNVMLVESFVNKYDPDEIEKITSSYALEAKMLKRFVKLLKISECDNLPPRKPDDASLIALPVIPDENVQTTYVTEEYFADVLLHSQAENMYDFLLNYVLHSSQFDD